MSQSSLLPAPGSHFISLARAIEMTGLFRVQKENILEEEFKNEDILPISETFNRSDLETLLAKPGCAALRTYFGMDESLKVRLVIVAVNEEADDILPLPSVNEEEEDPGYAVEEGIRCPPICANPSPLNS